MGRAPIVVGLLLVPAASAVNASPLVFAIVTLPAALLVAACPSALLHDLAVLGCCCLCAAGCKLVAVCVSCMLAGVSCGLALIAVTVGFCLSATAVAMLCKPPPGKGFMGSVAAVLGTAGLLATALGGIAAVLCTADVLATAVLPPLAAAMLDADAWESELPEALALASIDKSQAFAAAAFGTAAGSSAAAGWTEAALVLGRVGRLAA